MHLETLYEQLNRTVLAALPQQHAKSELNTFYTLIRDYPERRGKQLRGVFVLLSCLMHGGKLEDALAAAASLELFQNWVLIHDDIEDGSEERRGQPALHRVAGMPTALNVGDALHVYMWQCLFAVEHNKDAILNEFTQMIHRTAEGQHLDLSWVEHARFDISEADYLDMVTLKTSYYTVVAPLRLGALCANIEPDERFTQIGKDLGVAFQIRDDVLNLLNEGDAAYGKEFAGDLYEGKRTLILAHLLSVARPAERELYSEILSKARADKTEQDIVNLLAGIKKSGSLEYAQNVSQQRAESGLKLLNEATDALPEQAAVSKLTGLLESLSKRRV